MGNPVCQGAVGAAGEVPVEVSPVWQVTAALLETAQVDDGNSHHAAAQLGRVQVVHGPAHDFDTVQFVTVNRAGQAQGRALVDTIDHQHRGNLGQPGDLYTGRPG